MSKHLFRNGIIFLTCMSLFTFPMEVLGATSILFKTKTRQLIEELQKEVKDLSEQQQHLAGKVESLRKPDYVFENIEKKIKRLDAYLKDELRIMIMSLEVDVSFIISILTKKKGNAMNTFRESLKEELIEQHLERDRVIASKVTKLAKELKEKDEKISSMTAIIEEKAKARQSKLLSLVSTNTTTTKSLEEENRKNLLVISQMFKLLDEKDNEIASLAERLENLEDFIGDHKTPINSNLKKKME